MADDQERRWSLWQAIYEERSAAKAVATSVAGLAGLLTYYVRGDWGLAAWTVVVAFPACWVLAEPVRGRLLEQTKRRRQKKRVKAIFDNLGHEERAVVEAFVHSGGCAIDQDSYAKRGFSRNGIESLASRGHLRHSTTAAGYREKYVLDEDLFDYARTVVEEIPF